MSTQTQPNQSQSSAPLTKKQRKELQRKEKLAEREKVRSKKQRVRVISWGALIAALAIGVLSLFYLTKNPKQSDTAPPLSVDAIQSSDHISGNKESKTVLIEYSDFQCPACAVYYPITKKLLETNGAKVQFVYRYFPLQAIHKNAFGGAQAAEAAGKQNKFWEMHDLLFERQKEWSDEKNVRDVLVRYAGELGLNIGQFIADFENAETKTRIDSDYQSGVRAGVEGTPTFFINGAKIDNPRSYDEFQKLIDSVVAKKS
jgi:protein-disulfide isomerase